MRVPKLLADIGGTNARFALETSSGVITAICVLPCKDFPTIADAMRHYLNLRATQACLPIPAYEGAIAIANPVTGDYVRMTNHHWEFSIESLRKELGFEKLLVVNDFKALAMSLPHLSDNAKVQIGRGSPVAGTAIGLIGPGTGLGVSGLIPCGNEWVALDSEGGHTSFSPIDDIEIDILRFAMRVHKHVSSERLISGIGLDTVYLALSEIRGQALSPRSNAEIVQKGLAKECPVCEETVARFCEMLGTAAGNLAVTLCAKGGVYIGGGIVPRLGDYFALSGFRARFEQKGRMQGLLETIPTYVITAQYPAFIGLSAMLY